MSNIFSKLGGKVKYTPDRVRSEISEVTPTQQEEIKELALERDNILANLLENDILLDMLDSAINEQMKDFALPLAEANGFCDGPIVTWECYKKAKELLRIAPWIANGYDPVQLTWTDRFKKRRGKVIFDCLDYDPNTFLDSEDVEGENGASEYVTPLELEQAAQENQKNWALHVLFWDLLWGRPEIKPSNDPTEIRTLEDELKRIDEIKAEGDKLKQQGNIEGAEQKHQYALKLLKQYQNRNYKNIVKLGRPTDWRQLVWQGTTGSIETNINIDNVIKKGDLYLKDPISANLPWVDDAIALWLEPGSLFTSKDKYKDKSIPMMKSGFILNILIGLFSLVPKTAFYFIKWRISALKNIKGVRKVPIAGKLLYDIIKGLISIPVSIMAALSNIGIEGCIKLAMFPNGYILNISDEGIATDGQSDDPTTPDVNDTIAGYVPYECLNKAQVIVNAVHKEV